MQAFITGRRGEHVLVEGCSEEMGINVQILRGSMEKMDQSGMVPSKECTGWGNGSLSLYGQEGFLEE